MRTALALISLMAIGLLAGCGQPAGKADLKADHKLRAEILAACADGTHHDAQECSNAKALENAEKLDRSLGGK